MTRAALLCLLLTAPSTAAAQAAEPSLPADSPPAALPPTASAPADTRAQARTRAAAGVEAWRSAQGAFRLDVDAALRVELVDAGIVDAACQRATRCPVDAAAIAPDASFACGMVADLGARGLSADAVANALRQGAATPRQLPTAAALRALAGQTGDCQLRPAQLLAGFETARDEAAASADATLAFSLGADLPGDLDSLEVACTPLDPAGAMLLCEVNGVVIPVEADVLEATSQRSLLSGAGLPIASESALLVGTTDFLLERSELELEAWMLERFGARHCGTLALAQVRVATLFPHSCALLDADEPGKSVLYLTTGAASLQAAARRDIVGLARNLGEELLRIHPVTVQADARPELAPVHDLAAALAVVGAMVELTVEGGLPHAVAAAWSRQFPGRVPVLVQRQAPTGITLEGLQQLPLRFDQAPLASSLYTLSGLLAALPPLDLARDPETGQLQLSGKADDHPLGARHLALLVNLASNEILPRGGLRTDGLLLPPAPAVIDDPQQAAQALVAWLDQVRGWVRTVNDLQALGERLHNTAWDAAALYRYAADLVRALDADAAVDATLTDARLDALVDAVFGLSRGSVEVGRLLCDIEALWPLRKEGEVSIARAPAAVVAALDLAQGVLAWAHALSEAAIANDQAALLQALLSPPASLADALAGSGMDQAGRVARMATFTSALAQAETADSAKAAIEAAAAPPGGYVQKRTGDQVGYWTLNGYVGGGAGGEVLLSQPASGEALGGAVWPMISVGPEVGLRVGRNGRHPWSLGLYAPLLDLGAIGSWRLNNDGNDAELPTVNVRQVFAPGLGLRVGLPGAPLSLGLDGNLLPAMRELTPEGEAVEREVSAIRFGASLGVDIPILR